MKRSILLIALCSLITILFISIRPSQKKENTKTVNPDLFLTNDTNYTLETVDCTLSDGTKTKCYKINTIGLTPTDHDIGPWCPEETNDGADKGGIWFKDGKIYDVDGQFITELATLYHDDFWKLYDDNGTINKTRTKADCLELANAQLVEKFNNYCIECLPEYIAGMTKSYLIPITPSKLDTPISLRGQPKGGPGQDGPPGDRPSNGRPGEDEPPPGGRPGEDGPPRGERPNGPPPGGKRGPVVRGLAFNGIPFDAPAPMHIILKGYTIPPLDNAGGHINMDAGYHYHAATGLSTKHKHTDNHAAMIGYAMDGFGIYEHLDTDGTEPQDLDECRGHFDEARGYHYHVDTPGNNNFINCFSGATAKE